ncbi:hypothetical protein ACOJIV_12610 [Haloarcula sp. AONF1]
MATAGRESRDCPATGLLSPFRGPRDAAATAQRPPVRRRDDDAISTGAPGLLASLLGKPWLVDVRDLWIDTSISLGYIKSKSTIPALPLQIAIESPS